MINVDNLFMHFKKQDPFPKYIQSLLLTEPIPFFLQC